MTDVNRLIEARQKTHGDFRDVADQSQRLEATLRDGENWAGMEAFLREGLKMIMHKAARISSGDPRFAEHWDDIAGYATRVAGYLRTEKENEKREDRTSDDEEEVPRSVAEGIKAVARTLAPSPLPPVARPLGRPSFRHLESE